MSHNKLARQAKIKEIISNQEISSQEDLCKFLETSGFETTQATLSRDLHELGIVRIPSESGFKYVFHLEDNDGALKQLIGMEIINVLHNESAVIIKTMPGISVVSGAFIMNVEDENFGEDGMLLFADCAVHPDPTAKELAEIAVATGNTAKSIAKIEPKIALLSFSTKGSAEHELVDKVVEATKIAKKLAPNFMIDGELQADAAIVESVAKKKAPDCKIKGKALWLKK